MAAACAAVAVPCSAVAPPASDEEEEPEPEELPVVLPLKRLERLQRDKANPIQIITRICFMDKPRAAVLGKQAASSLKASYSQ